MYNTLIIALHQQS